MKGRGIWDYLHNREWIPPSTREEQEVVVLKNKKALLVTHTGGQPSVLRISEDDDGNSSGETLSFAQNPPFQFEIREAGQRSDSEAQIDEPEEWGEDGYSRMGLRDWARKLVGIKY